MCCKRIPLTLLLVFGISAAACLDWNITDDQKKAFQKIPNDKTSADFKTTEAVGLEIFENNQTAIALCILKISESEFHIYQVNWTTAKLMKSGRFTASTLEKIKRAGEMYAILNLISTSDVLSQFETKLKTLGLAGTIRFLEIDSKAGKYAALIKYEDGLFGFAPCLNTKVCNEGKMTDDLDLVVLGYSQKMKYQGLATQSLLKYLCNDASFGGVTILPALYSGAENLAEMAIEGAENEITEIIDARVGIAQNQISVKVAKAWSVVKHTHCIGLCSVILNQSKLRYFFVIYTSSKKENEVKLTSFLYLGSLGQTEFGTMMGLVDYLKPNHISGEIRRPKKSGVSFVAELIYAADFAARKHLERNRTGELYQKTSDQIPFINYPLGIAKSVSDSVGDCDWKYYAAIILHDTLSETNTTADEIQKYFDSEVTKIVDRIEKLTTQIPIKPMRANKAVIKMLDILSYSATSLVEGTVLQSPESVLTTLLKDRRKKGYVKQKITSEPPQFTTSLDEVLSVENKLYAIHSLTEVGNDPKKYYFRVDISDPSSENAGAVVSELHEDLESITTFQYGDISIANTYKKNIGIVASKGDLTKVLQCLEYGARKHFHSYQRRKDVLKTPYINHPIGVALILIHEGGIENLVLMLAAILHDTIENTSATYDELSVLFGSEVATIVAEVSDSTTTGAGGVAETGDKKSLQNKKAETQSPGAVLVKLADRIYNLRDFDRQCPPDYDETKRRWQFTNARELLAGFDINFNVNNKEVWGVLDTYTAAYKNLFAILDSITTVQQDLEKTPLKFMQQLDTVQLNP